MKDIDITVFIPVYNGASFLKEAIDSVIAQTFAHFELLIIDDGSTDESAKIIKSYTDPRIRFLSNGSNRGLTYTRQRSITEARGKYIALLDCDDVALKDRLRIQYNVMEAHPEVVLTGGRAIITDGTGRQIGESTDYSTANNRLLMLFDNVFINSSIMMRTAIVRREGSYSEYEICEDYDLSMRLSRKYQVKNLSDFVVKYRKHGENISIRHLESIRRVERSIIRDTHQYFNIPYNERLIAAQHSFLTRDTTPCALSDYFQLFKELGGANKRMEVYPSVELERIMFNKWYELVRLKAERNALFTFTKRPVFSWKFCTFKQFRKVFKQSLGV